MDSGSTSVHVVEGGRPRAPPPQPRRARSRQGRAEPTAGVIAAGQAPPSRREPTAEGSSRTACRTSARCRSAWRTPDSSSRSLPMRELRACRNPVTPLPVLAAAERRSVAACGPGCRTAWPRASRSVPSANPSQAPGSPASVPPRRAVPASPVELTARALGRKAPAAWRSAVGDPAAEAGPSSRRAFPWTNRGRRRSWYRTPRRLCSAVRRCGKRSQVPSGRIGPVYRRPPREDRPRGAAGAARCPQTIRR